VGCGEPPSLERLLTMAPVGQAFALALDRARKARESDLQRQLAALLQQFARAASASPFNLAAGLETLCAGADRLFGANRSSVWLHDRRARGMNLAASSDAARLAAPRQISTADALAPAAIALRRDRAE